MPSYVDGGHMTFTYAESTAASAAHLLMKAHTTEDQVKLNAAATTRGIGVSETIPGASDTVTLRMLNSPGSVLVTAGAAIDLNARLTGTTSGRVIELTDAGTQYTFGYAMEAATAAGDIIEMEIRPDSPSVFGGSIGTFEIDDLAITASKIATNAVTSAKVLAGNISTAKLKDENVTTSKLADDSVTLSKMADVSVDTASLVDDAVTLSKIADVAVDTAQLVDDAVTNSKIADTAVDTENLADDCITASKVDSGAIVAAGLGTSAVVAAKIAADAVTTVKIQDSAVTTSKLGADSVTNAKIGDGAIGAEHLASAAVVGSYGQGFTEGCWELTITSAMGASDRKSVV